MIKQKNLDDRVINLVEGAFAERQKHLDLDDDVLGMTMNCLIELIDEHGVVKERVEGHNLITTAGKQSLLTITSPKTLSQFSFMAVGTNATAANIADTTLGTEVARSTTITPTNPDANTLQFVNTFAAGVATGALTEVGMLTASSNGTLLNHLVFSVINKGASDSLQITMQFT